MSLNPMMMKMKRKRKRKVKKSKMMILRYKTNQIIQKSPKQKLSKNKRKEVTNLTKAIMMKRVKMLPVTMKSKVNLNLSALI